MTSCLGRWEGMERRWEGMERRWKGGHQGNMEGMVFDLTLEKI